MFDSLEQFIDPVFTYNFWQGPKEVQSVEAAKQSGLNCVALAHLSIKALFDYALPPEEHCYEMYRDTVRFTEVPTDSQIQKGDLFWFGPTRLKVQEDMFVPIYDGAGLLLNWRESPVRHVAVATGKVVRGDALLLHATHIEGTNVVWPRTKFAGYSRYEREYRVARLALGQ